jgi:NAD(P)-dependent dehydrogenase (short-subunit alcohol dehydrogenase family)
MTMMRRFEGKVALVTGAGGGIGRAVALAFAREGAKLALCDLATAPLAETTALAGKLGASVVCGEVNVTRSIEVEAFVQRTLDALGGLDCAVNNAGIRASLTPLAEVTEEEFDRVMAINTKGVWLCMKHEINVMLRHGGGAIVNIASGAGIVTVAHCSPYVTSKHAVVGLTKSGAVDYARHNIRINSVCPGYTRTPMALGSIEDTPGVTLDSVAEALPIGRIAEPDEQAQAVLYLCSAEASFVLGHSLIVDGGHSII